MSHKDKRPDAPNHFCRVRGERRGVTSFKNSRGIINPLVDLCKGAVNIIFSTFTGMMGGEMKTDRAPNPAIPSILPTPTYLPNNRCGHDPSNLRVFEKPAHHAKRPWILINASERLNEAILACSSKNKVLNKILNPLLTMNPSRRKKRSERREAFLLLFDYIVHYTDLATFSVGIPRSDGSFYYYNVDEMAQAVKLTYKRTLRALQDFKTVGYLKLVPDSSKKDTKGRYFFRLEVTNRLFLDLGTKYAVIERARAYALKAREKINPGFIKGLNNLTGHLTQVAKKASRGLSPKSVDEAKKKAIEKNAQLEKARIVQFQALMASQPNRSRHELYEEAFGRKYPLFDTS